MGALNCSQGESNHKPHDGNTTVPTTAILARIMSDPNTEATYACMALTEDTMKNNSKTDELNLIEDGLQVELQGVRCYTGCVHEDKARSWASRTPLRMRSARGSRFRRRW